MPVEDSPETAMSVLMPTEAERDAGTYYLNADRTWTVPVGPDLVAIEALAGTGLLARTGANTWALRTLTGTAAEITVTDGDGVAGAPTLSLPAALTFTGKTVTGGTFTGLTSLSSASLTATGLTSGRVPFVSTGGLISDSARLTWDNTNQQMVVGDGLGTAGVALNGAVSTRFFDFQTAGSLRWRFRVNNTAEGGSNAGSDWGIQAYTDAGATIDVPLSIVRAASGAITLARPVTVSSGNYLLVGTATRAGSELVRVFGSTRLDGGLTSVDATASTSTSTGAVILTAGGMGVAGRVCAGSLLASGLTSGRVPYVSTGGLLTDSGRLLWDNTNHQLTAGDGTGAAGVAVNGAVSTRYFDFQTAGSLRWRFRVNNTAESGSNAGSDWGVQAYSDAGATIDVPLSIARAAGGAVTIVRPLTLSTASTGLTLARTTDTTLVVSSTQASTTAITGCATFAGGVGIAGALNVGGSLSNFSSTTNGAHAVNINNGSNGASATARVQMINDVTVALSLDSYGSGSTGTRFGITRANYAGVIGEGASCAGLLIGCQGVAKPIIFGINTAEVARFDTSGNLQLADAKNIILNTSTGTKIGTAAAQKIGFWNTTPVVQPAGANQAAITDSTGGTAGFTLAAITAGAAYDQADMTAVKNALASLARLQNEIRTALVSTGVMKGAA